MEIRVSVLGKHTGMTLTEYRMQAMRNFIELNASPSKRNAVYIAVVASRNENVSEALIKSEAEKNEMVQSVSSGAVGEFREIVNSATADFNENSSEKTND